MSFGVVEFVFCLSLGFVSAGTLFYACAAGLSVFKALRAC